VLDLLRSGDVEDLPDASQILPYLDLFTVVALQSAPTVGMVVSAYAEPRRFIFRNGDFQATRAALTNPNVIQLFEVVNNPPLVHGPFIGFDPNSPKYYWRLPIDAEIILAMVICRFYDTMREWEELQLIQQIHTQLLIRNNFIEIGRGRGDGNGDRGDGRGRGRGRGHGRGASGNRGRGRGAGGNRGRGRGRGASGNRGRGRRAAISKEPQYKKNCWEWGRDGELDEQASDLSCEQF